MILMSFAFAENAISGADLGHDAVFIALVHLICFRFISNDFLCCIF